MHLCNLLLTNNLPLGKGTIQRKKGDWFHSIVVFSKPDITTLQAEMKIEIQYVHFTNEGVSFNFSSLQCLRKNVFYVENFQSFAILGKIRCESALIDSIISTNLPLHHMISLAFQKWGNERIPYIHQYDESYNCIAFSDDLIYRIKFGEWNPRIVKNHAKYLLTY